MPTALDPETSRRLLEQALLFEPSGEGWEIRGEQRGSWYAYDEPPEASGHRRRRHRASRRLELGDGRPRGLARSSRRRRCDPTQIIDRFWFRSIYFREPSGVLFEIATMGPGFTTDEPLEHLGESLVLPPAFEHLRERVEQMLTPLPKPRERAPR